MPIAFGGNACASLELMRSGSASWRTTACEADCNLPCDHSHPLRMTSAISSRFKRNEINNAQDQNRVGSPLLTDELSSRVERVPALMGFELISSSAAKPQSSVNASAT